MKNKENSNSRGVYWRENKKKWSAFVSRKGKSYYLGVFENKEDAIKMRNTALQKIEENCFEEWFNHELSTKKKQKRNCVNFLPIQKKWNTVITHNYKNYHLGNFENKEDAESIRDTAKEMIANGTFLEWYGEHRKKLEESNKAGHKGVYRHQNRWKVEIGYNKKRYYFGSFSDKNEAIKIYELVQQKILIGIFEDWYENIYCCEKSKESIIDRKTPLCKGVVYNGETQLYYAYIYYNKKKYSLCSSKDIKKAIAIRKEAEKHIKTDFIEWFNDYKENNQSEPISKETGIYFHKKSETWFPIIFYKSKKYNLGYFKNKDDAINIRKIAESYKKNGTFLKWFNDYKNLKKKQKMTNRNQLP